VSPPAPRQRGSGLRRYRAERLLRKEFSGLRSKVLAIVRSQLRSKGIALDPTDLEGCYAQAWHGLYATVLGGEEVENPKAWLVLVTFRRALDESRSAVRVDVGREAHPEGHRRAPAQHSELAGERLRAVSDPDLARELDDRARLRQVFEGLRTRLSERECEAASLCYLQGLSRAEAAERMGIAEARMRKLMEGASGRPGVAGKFAELLGTIKAGGWCEQQSSLMRAYAFGILDPDGERHGLAVAHCRECSACRAHVASLRGLAAVLPPPLLPWQAVLSGGTRTGAAAKASSGVSGSLTAKLAATAVIVLGAGYGVLGSHAHGSTPAHRTGARSAGLSKPPAHASRASSNTHVHVRRSDRRSSRARGHSTRKARPIGGASNYEFSPERVGSQPPPARVPQPSRGGTEFGFE
jgi:DNA-directed RNA polymerase specialized sigma24 family protein